MKNDSNHTNEQEEILLHPSIDLTSAKHTFVGAGHTMPDIPLIKGIYHIPL